MYFVEEYMYEVDTVTQTGKLPPGPSPGSSQHRHTLITVHGAKLKYAGRGL